ncbi:unnamed protein product [Lathyrus sativus]|nr:unnamed protein product [Lathyrus sativus]
MMRVSMAWQKLVMSDLFKGISCKFGHNYPNFWGFLLIKGLQLCKQENLYGLGKYVPKWYLKSDLLS